MQNPGTLTAIVIGVAVAVGIALKPEPASRPADVAVDVSAVDAAMDSLDVADAMDAPPPPAITDEAGPACEPGYMFVMGGVEDPSTVPDPGTAAKYGPAVWSLVEGYGAHYVVRSTPAVVYEGNWPDWKVAVISAWDCLETARTFWNSDAYQTEVKPLRKDAGVWTVGLFPKANPGTPADVQDYVPDGCNDPFLVVTMSRVTDPDAYGAYGRAIVQSNLARRSGFSLLFGGTPVEMLEEEWPDGYRAMVSTYPCRAAWEAFYQGEPYVSEIKPLRDGAGDFIIVGFEPERVD